LKAPTHPETFFNFFDVTESVSLHNAERENHYDGNKESSQEGRPQEGSACKEGSKKSYEEEIVRGWLTGRTFGFALFLWL
jgi:hypothetical protein